MTDQVLKQQVHDYVESIWEDAVADIATLVAIRSVEDLDHAEEGKPYGPKPYEALSEAVRIASRLGLDAHNLDGHIGYADVPGASDRQLAMIAHTDIPSTSIVVLTIAMLLSIRSLLAVFVLSLDFLWLF